MTGRRKGAEMDDYLEGLNPQQREAVTSTEGYVRVIAGAGSGKTKALSSRFAYLVMEMGILPSHILCVTFTNKKLDALRETVPLVPADKILVETDSPYLAPMQYRGKVKRNSPELVVHTARFLAGERCVPEEKFFEQTTENAKKLFGI